LKVNLLHKKWESRRLEHRSTQVVADITTWN